MPCRFLLTVGLATLCALVPSVRPSHSGEPRPSLLFRAAPPHQGRKAVERGLDFLQKDAAKWRKDRQCATCHHGTMTVWAFSEAKSQGYAIDKFKKDSRDLSVDVGV